MGPKASLRQAYVASRRSIEIERRARRSDAGAASACACQRLPTVNSGCCSAAARFTKARVRNVAALEVDSHFFPDPLSWEGAW